MVNAPGQLTSSSITSNRVRSSHWESHDITTEFIVFFSSRLELVSRSSILLSIAASGLVPIGGVDRVSASSLWLKLDSSELIELRLSLGFLELGLLTLSSSMDSSVLGVASHCDWSMNL